MIDRWLAFCLQSIHDGSPELFSHLSYFQAHRTFKRIMANHLSALKRARQTETRTVRNRTNTSRLRTALRGLREAVATGDKKAAQGVYRSATSAIDKAVQKGILHKNTAARYKSRLNLRLNKIGGK
jgi:small subunit ribosomal protein S20